MTFHKTKTVLVFGLSILTATSALALNKSASPAASATASASEEASEKRSDATIDPVIAVEIERMTSQGLVGQRIEDATRLRQIESQTNFWAKVAALYERLGVEQFKKQFPELAAQLEGSPIEINAKTALLEAKAREKDARENLEGVEAAPVAMRSDGSMNAPANFPQIPLPGAKATPADDVIEGEMDEDVAALLKEMNDRLAIAEKKAAQAASMAKAAKAAPKIPEKSISLRALMGGSGDYAAKIVYGTDELKVRSGDTLSQGVKVLSIDATSLTIDRNGDVSKLSLK